MRFLEEDLEKIIWEESQTPEGKQRLFNKGLYVDGIMFRQLDLYPYGRADLVSIGEFWRTEVPTITIYELKKDVINVNTAIQGYRYLQAIKEIMVGKQYDYTIRLIGKRVDDFSDWIYLTKELNGLEIFTFKYDTNGISFEQQAMDWEKPQITNNDTKELLLNAYSDYIKNHQNK